MDILMNFDVWVAGLIAGSGFVLLVLLRILKVLAKRTKWSGDDKIVEMLIEMVKYFKKK